MTSTYGKFKQQVQNIEKEVVDQQNDDISDTLTQRYLHVILNNTKIPVYLKNDNYEYIFMNRQLGVLANVDHTQVKGKNDFEIFSEPVAQLFRSQDEEVVKRRELIEFEETILLADGVQTFITAKFPLFDTEGNVSAVGGACTDITARKKTEAELKEAEEKYRGIFENSPLGIVQFDNKGVITASNQKFAGILDSNVEKIIGFDFLQSIGDEELRAVISSVLSGQIAHHKGSCPSNTGEGSVYLRYIFSPLTSTDGSVVAAIGIIEDITRRKYAEEALLKAHEELEQRVSDRTAQLDRKTKRLMETNIALKILLEKREEDRKEFEEDVMLNVEKLIYPYLEKLKMRESDATTKALLNIVQANLEEITSSFKNIHHRSVLSNLTPAQIQTADLIKQGHTTKEIASLLNLSPSTIACHRQEIRKRLSLTNKRMNLQTALTVSP